MTDHATMRDKAVALARQGFRVFPLPAGKKSPPLVPDWAGIPAPPRGAYHQHVPSSDPELVARMWSGPYPAEAHYNIGISTNDLLVVDVDNKDGKDGEAGLRALAGGDRISLTTEVRTPTGGRHLYYRLPEGVSVRSTQGELAEGIDTRSWNGYVVAPGSRVAAGEYKVVSHVAPLSEAPESLIKAHRALTDADKRPKVAAVADGVELDSDAALTRAREFCADAQEAVEGAGGREVTKHLLFRLGDFGLSALAAVELLCEPDGWNERCSPPWDYDTLLEFAEGLEGSRDNALGCDNPLHQFPAVEIDAKPVATLDDKFAQAARAKLFFRRSKEAAERSSIAGDSLIRKYLGKGEMSVLYGDSNTGKTFVALDIGYHIATKQTWNGQKVSNGLTVYVAAEAGESINSRVKAWMTRHNIAGDPPLAIVPCQVDLHSPTAEIEPLLVLLKEISAAYGMPIAFVVLDTLARVMGNGDENTARDMGMLVKSVGRIQGETGAHVMLVHHSGKVATKGARGSSALRAATDTEIEVEGGQLIMKKQRNGEILKPVRFNLKTVQLGTDEEGESVTSCVVELGAVVDFEPQLTAEQQEWVDEIKDYQQRALEMLQ